MENSNVVQYVGILRVLVSMREDVDLTNEIGGFMPSVLVALNG